MGLVKIAALVSLSLSGAVLAAAPVLDARPCAPAAVKLGARCGVVYVPENPARAHGRKIGLNVIVLPATGAREPGHAQYDLEGGPGFAATDFVEFYAREGAAYRERRDIVLADMRGTGASNPLRCAGIEERQQRQPGAPLYPPELIDECAQQSRVASDPAQYTTAAAARDIEAIRKALKYEQLDLNAISYGTTLALRYIAEYPRRVRSAVFMGTVPAGRTPPRFHAPAAERALQSLAADCAADAKCKRESGDMDANLQTALQRLTSVSTPTAPQFMEQLRNQLYAPVTRARVPALLARAAAGDFGELAGRGSGRVFADGLYLSITCAESFPFMDVDAAIAESRATRFGAYRLERQREACAHWPVGPRDPRLLLEPASVVPALFLAGALDPVAPAEWATEIAKRFSRGRVVVAPQGAHVFDGLSGLDTCLDAMILRFLDTADAGALDASCFNTMRPPPFGADP